MIDNMLQQLRSVSRRANLQALFGDLVFDPQDAEALSICGEGESAGIRFSNDAGPVGVLTVDLHDTGDPEDEGLAVGLRGWMLDDDVASV